MALASASGSDCGGMGTGPQTPEPPDLILPARYSTLPACFLAISLKPGPTTFLSTPWQAVQLYLPSKAMAALASLLTSALGAAGAAAGADAGTKVSFAGTPTSVTPGTNFNVFMKLTDTYGNNVNATAGDIKVTYAGLGIPLSTLPNDTDASGEASFTVLVGSGTGTGTVTFTFDADADGTVEAADGDFTSSYTITIAAVEPVAKIGSFNGRVAVRVENAKGSTISVKIGRQWYKYSALNNNYLQSWKSRKGASVAVSVYVDGDLQNVQTITVR